MLIKSNFLAHLDYAAWYNHYVSSQITYFKLRFNTIEKTTYFNYYKTKIPSLLASFIKQKVSSNLEEKCSLRIIRCAFCIQIGRYL